MDIIEYALAEGFIHNWEVAGPLWTPEPLGRSPEPPDQAPVELTDFVVEDQPVTWAYYRCSQDHLIDLSAQYPRQGHANAWAYVLLKTPATASAALTVFAPGEIQVFLNGQVLKSAEEHANPGHNYPSHRFLAPLAEENTLFVRFAVCLLDKRLHL